MGWLPEKGCLAEPTYLIRFVILFVCAVFTVIQVTECFQKLVHPPVSTHYQLMLNDTIRYPCLTICRRPPFKTTLYREFGMSPHTPLETYFAFRDFLFGNRTLVDFMESTTFSFDDMIDITILKSYHLTRGRCYTLQPHLPSSSFSPSGGYFLFFKHNVINQGVDEYGISTSGYEIFLHDPNEVLTYQDDQKDSFLEGIYLETSEDMIVVLDVKQFGRIPSTDYKCSAEPFYSRSKCLELCVNVQVTMNAGCSVPWLSLPENITYAECDSFLSVRDLISDHRQAASRRRYIQNCDCPIACNVTQYTTSIVNRRATDEGNAPNSMISMYFKSNVVIVMNEIIGYDWNQLISDVGGSLGFLLGLSVLSLICLTEEICRLIFRWMFKRKIRRQQEMEKKEEQLNSKNKQSEENKHSEENKESEETDKDNTQKNLATAPVEGNKNDYKYLKDFVTDYRFFEKDLVDKTHDKVNKY